jgi:hypothetical protein
MVPNFNDELNLKNSSRTVATGGPCNWQTGDESAEIRDVRVEQGSVVGLSGTTASTTVRNGQGDQWWLDAGSSSQFTRGPARVKAIALVRRTDGTTYEYPWDEEVQLH